MYRIHHIYPLYLGYHILDSMKNLTSTSFLTFKPFMYTLWCIFQYELRVLTFQCNISNKQLWFPSVISKIAPYIAYRIKNRTYDPFISCMTFTHKKIEPIIYNSLVMTSIWKLPLPCDGVRKPVPVTPMIKLKTLKRYKKKTTGPFSTIFWGFNALTLYFHNLK